MANTGGTAYKPKKKRIGELIATTGLPPTSDQQAAAGAHRQAQRQQRDQVAQQKANVREARGNLADQVTNVRVKKIGDQVKAMKRKKGGKGTPLASLVPPANTATSGPRKGQAFDVVHRDGKRFHRYTKADGTKQYVADKEAPSTKRKLFGAR